MKRLEGPVQLTLGSGRPKGPNLVAFAVVVVVVVSDDDDDDDYGKPSGVSGVTGGNQENPVGLAGIPTEIRAGHLPKTDQMHSRLMHHTQLSDITQQFATPAIETT